jgi:hypothetical protein
LGEAEVPGMKSLLNVQLDIEHSTEPFFPAKTVVYQNSFEFTVMGSVYVNRVSLFSFMPDLPVYAYGEHVFFLILFRQAIVQTSSW